MRQEWSLKVIHHPAVGTLDLEYTDFDLPGDPHVSIVTYTAAPGSPSADGHVLLASWAQTRKAAAQKADGPADQRRG
ncbi:hypothetical protein [Streptomyces sp. NPDC013187]|uniref:MmyB family transcriptional regulator n=1 Tax=Streptomyces sp. NPDC013187 TaxID=3364865 RepID=UPI00368459CD